MWKWSKAHNRWREVILVSALLLQRTDPLKSSLSMIEYEGGNSMKAYLMQLNSHSFSTWRRDRNGRSCWVMPAVRSMQREFSSFSGSPQYLLSNFTTCGDWLRWATLQMNANWNYRWIEIPETRRQLPKKEFIPLIQSNNGNEFQIFEQKRKLDLCISFEFRTNICDGVHIAGMKMLKRLS